VEWRPTYPYELLLCFFLESLTIVLARTNNREPCLYELDGRNATGSKRSCSRLSLETYGLGIKDQERRRELVPGPLLPVATIDSSRDEQTQSPRPKKAATGREQLAEQRPEHPRRAEARSNVVLVLAVERSKSKSRRGKSKSRRRTATTALTARMTDRLLYPRRAVSIVSSRLKATPRPSGRRHRPAKYRASACHLRVPSGLVRQQ